MESKIFERTLDSVRLPIQHFIDTGIFDLGVLGESNWNADISFVQVRRACRKVAAELKRPFIQMESYTRYIDHSYSTLPDGTTEYTSVKLDKPRWVSATVTIPKRKYLVGHISPLTLAAGDLGSACYARPTPSLWHFTITDYSLFKEYEKYILTDPACRKARKLTS
jgi:hypothetical protein